MFKNHRCPLLVVVTTAKRGDENTTKTGYVSTGNASSQNAMPDEMLQIPKTSLYGSCHASVVGVFVTIERW